jgi:hypothetical protein
MYQIIYNYIITYLIGGTLDANQIMMAVLMSHLSIWMLYFVLVSFIVASYRFVSGLFRI